MRPPLPRIAALLALPALGCLEASIVKDLGDSDGIHEPPAVDDYLRLDVFPSQSNPDLLPETHQIDEVWQGLRIEMQGVATCTGLIQGYDATPYLDVSVPGSTVPVRASVALSLPGTVMGATANSDPEQEGFFSLSVPRADGYLLQVRPIEPALLPFRVVEGFSLVEDRIGEIVDLGYGAPVYGHARQLDGLPVEGVPLLVQARDPESGAAGTPVAVAEDGSFQLRVEPGARYEIALSGAEGELVPTVVQALVVEDEEGAELDFALGSLAPLELSGRLTRASDGVAIAGATVRFTALELRDFPGAAFTVEDTTSSLGEYRIALLAGRYQAEYIAPAEHLLSPILDVLDVDEESAGEDDDRALEGLTGIASQVLGPGGEPLAGVAVLATEQGFDGATYATSTDEGGYLALDVPSTKLTYMLTPPDGSAAVSYIEPPADAFPAILMLERGDLVSGVVVSGDDPVANALIEIRDGEGRLYASTLSGEDGSFRVRVLWEGRRDAAAMP